MNVDEPTWELVITRPGFPDQRFVPVAEVERLRAVLEAAKHALVVDGIAVRRDPHDPRVHVAGKLLMLINDELRREAMGAK
jgi:hypothetical protein